ncbi:MAG: hypothetical protein K2O18_06605 [Oscillospiraceae bacterium]|nr:hypothetical protein [Oscillospiraceae bacterium]
MRKRKMILGLALVLTLLSSCGREPQDAYWKDSDRPSAAQAAGTRQAENSSEQLANAGGQPEEAAPLSAVPSPVLPQGEEPVTGADRAAMLKAYSDVLHGFYDGHVDHTGQDLGYYEESGMGLNRFAVYDVDLDGQDELLVSYTTTLASAGVREYVLGYDAESGTVREEFSGNPTVIYYDNGVIEALWYYNRGRAGDVLWPYTFWRYDPQADAYRATEMADAWDKSLVEEGFPDSADKDGDGVVYYLIEYGDYVDYNSDTPVDKSGYDTWRESFLGGANELPVPFVDLDESNINSIR